jgi:hypothetical protein
MRILETLIGNLRAACSTLPDRRTGKNTIYSMAEIGLAAFSLFFMQSGSFLSHQRRLQEHYGSSNCQSLFGMSTIPSDNHIRQMLDGVAPAHFNELFEHTIQSVYAHDGLADFRRLDGHVLIALDGTEYACSRKIHCENCSHRQRADGKTEYFHTFVGATIVAPGHRRVLPLSPEFIAPQDGNAKQDCEIVAAQRWLEKHGKTSTPYAPIYLGDDLYAKQPVCQAVLDTKAHFLFTCKATSHKTIAEYAHGATFTEHRETRKISKELRTYSYRWLEAIPLRDSEDALLVNYLEVEVHNAKGKRTYRNSFITDLPIHRGNVQELADCARARWKIENETFNALKNHGYDLEHNFGHGKSTLAAVLAVLNLLAFGMHTACDLIESAWRATMERYGSRRYFFERLRNVTIDFVFADWAHLLHCLLTGERPPPPQPVPAP